MTVPAGEFSKSIAVESANGLINAAMLIGTDKLVPKAEENAREPQETVAGAQSTKPVEPTEAVVAQATVNHGIRENYLPVNGMVASSAYRPTLGL